MKTPTEPRHSAKKFLQNWLICTAAVLVAVHVVPGIHYQEGNFWTPFIAALLLGIFNAILRPVLLLLALPLLLLTFGLFFFVINAGLLWLVGALLKPQLYVDGFWPAFWGGLVLSFLNTIITTLLNIDVAISCCGSSLSNLPCDDTIIFVIKQIRATISFIKFPFP